MESINVDDIVRLSWPYGYDHGYGFASVKSKTSRTASANLVKTEIIENKSIDPVHYTKIVTSGAESQWSVTLLQSGSVKFSKDVKKELGVDPRRAGVSWQLWGATPIEEHHVCD
jgi:hypothetical protein